MAKDYNVVTVNLDDELYDKVNDLSYNMHLTRSDLIRDALRSFIAKEGNKMTVKDVYDITSCYVEIRRGNASGPVLFSEDYSDQVPDFINKHGDREVYQLCVSDDHKLIIAIEK